jgi:hypothetical protein
MGYDCTNKRNVCCAPYGRWASSALDPTVLTLQLADLIISGRSGQFAQGADDQDGPEAWIKQGQSALNGYVQQLAAKGRYWVGPLPGVDHWHTFLTSAPGVAASSPTGAALLLRGLQALSLPAQRPIWPVDLPICGAASPPMSSTGRSGFANFMIGMTAVGGLVGLGWLSLRVAKNLATSGTFLGAGRRRTDQ